MKLSTMIFCLIAGIGVQASALFENGKTTWQIRHAENADETVVFAARELSAALKKMSGADFPVTTRPATPEIVIAVDPEIGDPDVVSVTGGKDALRLAGGSPAAALHAVYSFLQRELGVRWLWPGDDGEFIPRKDTWELPAVHYTHRPQIKYRGFHLCGDWRDVENFRLWMARNFINIHRHAQAHKTWLKYGLHFMISDHNARLPRALFDTNPEYFAEIKGKRVASQPCYSNPEAEKLMLDNFIKTMEKYPDLEILGIFPPDSMDYCECAKCKEKGTSTAWFDFYNRLTDQLKERYPQLKFATIAYQGYIDIPANRVKNSEFVEYATYERCNIHTFDGSCERNNRLMKKMRAWADTGVVMGNYGYEFDIFRATLSLPFYTMIEDAVKTSAKLNHAAVITEISLSPKSGPDTRVHSVTNRLGLYLYAQLLWNPEAKMQDILRDWCGTAYGKAADAMFRYFTLLDQNWSGMKQHRTILGSPVDTAVEFLSKELRADVVKAFAAADQALGGQKNPHVEREKILFNQWLSLLEFSDQVNLPRLGKAEDFARASIAFPQVGFRAAWSGDALFFKDIKLPYVISLSSGGSGETWNFESDAAGRRTAWLMSAVGVRDSRWQPEWPYENGVIRIPFKSLGQAPEANDVWRIRIQQGDKVYPAQEMAALRFSAAAQTDRSVVWWNGMPDKETRHQDRIKSEFTQAGWQLTFASAGEELTAAVPTVYWLRHPRGTNRVPDECWPKIKAGVENGATAVFCSYWAMPLDQYFNDPSLKIEIVSAKNMTITERRARRHTVPGDWITRPNGLKWWLTGGIPPCYGTRPAVPEAWTVLATMDVDGKTPGVTVPYIMIRKYGKGNIFVLGDNIPAKPALLLDNMYTNLETLLKTGAGE